MKKQMLILFFLISFGIFARNIVNVPPRSGRIIKEDNNIVNEADSVEIIQITQDLSLGPLNYTTTFSESVRIVEVEIHFDVMVSETILITKVFSDPNYNALRKSQNLVGNKDFVFNDQIFLDTGSQLKVICTNNTATTNARVTISYSKVVR